MLRLMVILLPKCNDGGTNLKYAFDIFCKLWTDEECAKSAMSGYATKRYVGFKRTQSWEATLGQEPLVGPKYPGCDFGLDWRFRVCFHGCLFLSILLEQHAMGCP